MTTKTTTQTPRPTAASESMPDDLQTAYQVHTLAQMLYARLSAAPSWTPMVQVPYAQVLH